MASKPESRLAWTRVKQAAGSVFEMERQEDRSAGGRPDVLWCRPGTPPIVGRLELKYSTITAFHPVVERYVHHLLQLNGAKAPDGDGGRTCNTRGASLKRDEGSRGPNREAALDSGLRPDQGLVLGRWGSLGVPSGCLQRVDVKGHEPWWLYYEAPKKYPYSGMVELEDWTAWAKAVVAPRESWRLISRVWSGGLTTSALYYLLLHWTPLHDLSVVDPTFTRTS